MASIEAVLDLGKLRAEAAELEKQASAPDLWDDPEKAQQVTSRLSAVQGEIRRAEDLRRRLDDAQVLWDLAEDAGDEKEKAEAGAEVTSLRKSIDELEVRTLLSGEYDSREALVTIRSEAGGVDAADWAEMLLRMYLRWAERHGYPVEMLDTSYAEEAGIKSATFKVKAPYAYGTLSVEQGTHRLVRISPFDGNARRHTSFASAWVYPEVDDNIEIELIDKDLRVDTYRASGAGGQHVNKTDSAVRITHLPTGIAVAVQQERSQHQNRAKAIQMLKARLYEVELQKREAERLAAEANKTDIGWGHQIRSYVLQPYQMVKDLRTNVERSDPQKVLDGDLDEFMAASLAARVGEGGGKEAA